MCRRPGEASSATQEIGSLDDAGLTQLRRDRIGFVFQSFNLVPTLTAAENITLPADLAGVAIDREWFDSSSTSSASPTGYRTVRASCPAASSSGSRAPAH